MYMHDLLEEDTLYSFYGVNDNQFKLGNIVFEAIENEDDGYRSMLDAVPVVFSDRIFSRMPIVNVMYRDVSDGYFEGYEFYDETGHVWLKIGTSNVDDYYPIFKFDYEVRLDVTDYAEPLTNLDNYDPKHLHIEKLI